MNQLLYSVVTQLGKERIKEVIACWIINNLTRVASGLLPFLR